MRTWVVCLYVSRRPTVLRISDAEVLESPTEIEAKVSP